jgi:hypothetical protein
MAGDERKGFLLRLPPALLDELRRWAEQEMRSVNGQIEWIVREALGRRRGGDPGRDEPRKRR